MAGDAAKHDRTARRTDDGAVPSTRPMGTWVFVLAFVLVCYINGAGMIEAFVNYPSWAVIAPSETFGAYHRFIAPRVLVLLAAPTLLTALLCVLMLWYRPVALPRAAIWVAVALNAIVLASSALIQVPIQLEFSNGGFTLAALERLLSTNFWLRRLPYAALLVLFVAMLIRMLRPGHSTR